MAWYDRITGLFGGARNVNALQYYMREKTKGVTPLVETTFPVGIGVKHPYDFAESEKWYTDDPFVHGMVEKHVDFIMGGGFSPKCENPNAEELLEQTTEELDLKHLLRELVKRACINGGFLEMFTDKTGVPVSFNILDGKFMFIRLKQKISDNGATVLTNEVDGYTQFVDIRTTPVGIPFKESEVAYLAFNKIGDNPYGMGIIQPLKFTLRQKVSLMQDLAMMMHRKATTKLHIKVGSAENKLLPLDGELAAFGQRLESMTNLTDLVTGPYVEMNTVEFGDIGKSFTDPLVNLDKELIYGSQVPHVLMGVANVNEGIATEQMKAFMFRIKSLQDVVCDLVCKKIYGPVLKANGFDPLDCDIEWGAPTPDEKRADVTMYQGLLPQTFQLSPSFKVEMEKKLRSSLDFPEMEPEEEQSLLKPQPVMPPNGPMRPMNPNMPGKPGQQPPGKKPQPKQSFRLSENRIGNTVREYVGFNYLELIAYIKKFIDSPDFVNRTYKTADDTQTTDWEIIVSRYSLKDSLSTGQIDTLRDVLKDGFDNNKSILEIKQAILDKVKPEPYTYEADGITIDSETRATVLARTEVVRATNQGLLDKYSDDGIEQAQWLASVGDRTCDYCDSQNGQIMSIDEADEMIPAHASCRCTWTAIRNTVSPEVTQDGGQS